MTKTMLETTSVVALGSVTEERDAVKAAFQEVQSSFETFCLLAGIEAFQDLLEDEAADLCGERHQRHADRRGRRWGKARSPVAFHGGRVAIERPRVPDGQQELELPSLAAGQREDWLGRWAMNQMLINVSTRRFRRSVRLPDGDVASIKGDGTSKSAVVRGAVERETEGLAGNRSVASGPAGDPDLHVQEDLVLVAAVGIDATGEKHPLGLVEGATENAATVQALLDNLVERGLDPAVVRLFIIDGAKALSKAIRRTFGRNTPIQRCQVHKARNIAERLPKEAQARVRKALRQAWEMEDAARAEQLIRNLARRLDKEWPGTAATILEGLDEILCVVRLGLPKDLRRSLACTNIIENMNGTIRQVTRNVKRWRDASMALRWTAAGMMEARKGFRRLMGYKQLPTLKAALLAHQAARLVPATSDGGLACKGEAA
jgi:putative transposase